MFTPADLLPVLGAYGDIAYGYLSKHLTDDQLAEYLQHVRANKLTHGETFRLITREHGHEENVFYALEAMDRINTLYEAARSPATDPVEPEKSFLCAFMAFRAGLIVGAIVDDKGKQAILALAKHGKKFAESVGKHDDEFTVHLLSLFQEFHGSHGRYPRNKEVVAVLESQEGQGFIHTINDDVIEWGDNGSSTKLTTLANRLTKIREKIKSR